MIKFSTIINEAEVGKREVDPESGVATIFRGQDPQTGRMEWDVENPIDMEFLYHKIDELVKYTQGAKKGSQEDKIKLVLTKLRNSVARLK